VTTDGQDHRPPLEVGAARSKFDIRTRVLARRNGLSGAERAGLSERITTRLLALDAYRNAGCVMAYVGFGSEIDTTRFVAATLSQAKSLVLPRVERGSRTLKLYVVQDPEQQLEPGVWGIRQPRADLCPEISATQIEFVLVPGVAFTRDCERLGYGGGFYDRLISSLDPRPALVAGAFALQLLPELPMSDTDQQINRVITEDAEYQRNG